MSRMQTASLSSFRVAGDATTKSSGTMRRLKLPSGGVIEWTYGTWTYGSGATRCVADGGGDLIDPQSLRTARPQAATPA